MTPRALWLPYTVTDVDAAEHFYSVNLSMATVDRWRRDGERGVVLRATGAAYVELVAPAGGPGTVLAFELARVVWTEQ